MLPDQKTQPARTIGRISMHPTAFVHIHFIYACVYTFECLHVPVTVFMHVTQGHNFTLDSFIKCGAAGEAAVNQFYLLCFRG